MGPFSKEDLQEMIRARKLSSQDEVCESSKFWIPLHQKDELLANLGVEFPRDSEPEVTADPRTRILDSSNWNDATDPGIRKKASTPTSEGSSENIWRSLSTWVFGYGTPLIKYLLIPGAVVYFAWFFEKLLGSK